MRKNPAKDVGIQYAMRLPDALEDQHANMCARTKGALEKFERTCSGSSAAYGLHHIFFMFFCWAQTMMPIELHKLCATI